MIVILTYLEDDEDVNIDEEDDDEDGENEDDDDDEIEGDVGLKYLAKDNIDVSCDYNYYNCI